MPAGPTAEGLFFRPLHPRDHAALKLLHARLFPLDYDDAFFQRAAHGLDGILAWAAAAPLPTLTHVSVGPELVPQPRHGETHGHGELAAGEEAAEQLAGFITARSFPALFADPRDRQLLRLDSPSVDRERLLYVLTLGVAEPYQRQGIARRLLDFVLRYAAETACRAVYLHVAAFNQPARAFYSRAGFQQLALLPGFYTIRTGRQPVPGQQQYDACLFGCRIAPPQPTPWDGLNLAVQPLAAAITSLNACLPWGSDRRDDKRVTQPRARRVPVEVVEIGGGDSGTSGCAHSAAPDGQEGGQAAHQQPHVQRQLRTGVAQQTCGASAGTPPRWNALRLPLEQPTPLRSSGPQTGPPEWLRNLFTRR